MHSRNIAIVFARLALAAGFLSAVADRLGIWGPYGIVNVAGGIWTIFSLITDRIDAQGCQHHLDLLR